MEDRSFKRRKRRSRYRFDTVPQCVDVAIEKSTSMTREGQDQNRAAAGGLSEERLANCETGKRHASDREHRTSQRTSPPESCFEIEPRIDPLSAPFDVTAPNHISCFPDVSLVDQKLLSSCDDILERTANPLPEPFQNAGIDSPGYITHPSAADGHESITGNANIGSSYLPPEDLLVPNWRVLWSLIMTNGSRRLTKEQYQSVRVLMEASGRFSRESWTSDAFDGAPLTGDGIKISYLPHYSTLSKVWRPFLFGNLTVQHNDYSVSIDTTKAGARARQRTSDGLPETLVRVVLPSEYARSDVATPEVFKAMCSTSLSNHCHESDCIDLLPLIRARHWFYGPPTSISVDSSPRSGLYQNIAEAGDILRISLVNTNGARFDERFSRCFQTYPPTLSPHDSIEGEIVHVWPVHHESRRSTPHFTDDRLVDLSAPDRRIAEMYRFVSYVSPTDGINTYIPEIPHDLMPDKVTVDAENGVTQRKKKSPRLLEAESARRNALKAKRLAVASAWVTWKKPIVKPGDTIALLKPSTQTILPSTDRQSRILLVHRFWCENEERSRHVAWIPGGRDLDCDLPPPCALFFDSDEDIYLYIRYVELIRQHTGARGPLQFEPVSSIGILRSSEPYIVYRFLLYWDGFEVQSGKSASGDGVYLICINLPPRARSCPNAVRIISLTPPGVKADTVLGKIGDDLVEGMTTGFVDIDADGVRRRIFLDLVGFLGDTPALNAALDVLGHTGSSCCHLCRFIRRSKTSLGSRFTDETHIGSFSTSARSFYVHAAIRDCGASDETCRLLGMKADPSKANMVLHTLRQRILSAELRLARTITGSPVIPCALDPYRACLVGPDHLLTGHIRDCINLAFKLLPTTKHRETCEGFLLGLLSECFLPTQTRLFDKQKKSLYSMPMTELYALALVSGRAFDLACAQERARETSADSRVSERCKSAIDLVQSASRVIAVLWFKPDVHLDGSDSLDLYYFNSRASYFQRVQDLTDAHIRAIENVCLMKESNFAELEDQAVPRARRLDLEREYNACSAAIKIVDKPNVHRLRELVYTSLPMLGHLSMFGELVLEKAHQSLKRAIRQSNNKDIQMSAMQSAVFDDWQGRLSLSASVLSRDGITGESLRACIRFLAGPKALKSVSATSIPKYARHVQQALGPGFCATREMQTQGKGVLSSRFFLANGRQCDLNWTLHTPMHTFEPGSRPSALTRLKVFNLARASSIDDCDGLTIVFPSSITSSYISGAAGHSFTRGNVVEMLTLGGSDSSHHFPFVVQCRQVLPALSVSHSAQRSLWCIVEIVVLRHKSTEQRILAAVAPCKDHQSHNISSASIFTAHCTGRLSLAKLDQSARVVPALVVCSATHCSLSASRGLIRHMDPVSPLEGAEFSPVTREMGYPPRSG